MKNTVALAMESTKAAKQKQYRVDNADAIKESKKSTELITQILLKQRTSSIESIIKMLLQRTELITKML